MLDGEFASLGPQKVKLEKARLSAVYGHSVREDWEPSMTNENVQVGEEDEIEMTDVEFFAQSSPVESKQAMSRFWGGLKRIFKAISKSKETFSCSTGTATDTLPRNIRG